MIDRRAFEECLSDRGHLVIDGALATELEARGHHLNNPLWSGIVLKEQPESIRHVHYDYYMAGADIAITASYQATPQGLVEHLGLDEYGALELIKRSVLLANEAREAAVKTGITRKLLVAGSVGPYGAYLHDGSEYRGDYSIPHEEYKAFHRPRIQALIEAGVDLLAFETMPNIEEIQALLDLLNDEFDTAVGWLSCTLKDSHHLSDGTPLGGLVEAVHQYKERVLTIGVNCVPQAVVCDSIKHLRSLTDLPLLCYPNSGEIYDATTNQWHGVAADSNDTATVIQSWMEAGAALIGGCCRTGPAFVTAVSQTFASNGGTPSG